MFQNTTSLTFLTNEAYSSAVRYKNAMLTPDHLLYALCRTQDGRAAIEDIYEGNTRRILSFLTRSFKDRTNDDITSPAMGDEIHRFLSVVIALSQGDDDDTTNEGEMPEPLTDENQVNLNEKVLSIEDILDIMVSQCASFPILAAALNYGDVITFEDTDVDDADPEVFTKINEDDVEASFEEELNRQHAARQAAAQPTDPNMIAMISSLRNLSESAQDGSLDPVIGRESEIQDLVQILSRRRKPNALLVGEPGVGKTALVEGLAQRLSQDTPEHLKGRVLIEVSMTSLMAGTRYRGDFEARMKHLVDYAMRRRAILFIDEAHAMMGAGGNSGSGALDASNMLKPFLARGDMSVILATTPTESRSLVKDKAFARRFQKIMVEEPSFTNMVSILGQSREGYETHYKVELTEVAAHRIVETCVEFLPDRRFPDKAFDVLDHASQNASTRGSVEISLNDVDCAIEQMTGVHPGKPTSTSIEKAKGIEAYLNTVILGQTKVIETISRVVRQSLLGFSSSKGCASACLFNGPSGVGKTETAKALSTYLEIPFKRIDMSEYMDAHSISGLIGAPAGYVGYDDEGALIEAVESSSKIVLLLDEVDKAHPKVFDLLLQVMDAGRLTSADGRVVSFKGVHLIMTSNLGAAVAQTASIGFGRERNSESTMKEAISQHFRPEFLERLACMLNFNTLDIESVKKIVRKELSVLCDNFSVKGYTVTYGEDVIDYLITSLGGGAPSGRRIQRLISKECIDALALEIFESPSNTAFHMIASENGLKVSILEDI
jgi:ATP-dependent Clp protease ATP-binding subunit ClpA